MDKLAKNNQTGYHVSDDTNSANNIISQLFASTLGTKALTRSWWRRWVYPVLFLITLTLSLATYLTLDSIQQAVNMSSLRTRPATGLAASLVSRKASAENRSLEST